MHSRMIKLGMHLQLQLMHFSVVDLHLHSSPADSAEYYVTSCVLTSSCLQGGVTYLASESGQEALRITEFRAVVSSAQSGLPIRNQMRVLAITEAGHLSDDAQTRGVGEEQ